MGSYTWGMMNERLDRERIEIANVILDIVDREKLFVVHDDCTWDVEELRMQLREVAFALIQGKEVKASMLSWEKKRGHEETLYYYMLWYGVFPYNVCSAPRETK